MLKRYQKMYAAGLYLDLDALLFIGGSSPINIRRSLVMARMTLAYDG
jgi:hypothetical protein